MEESPHPVPAHAHRFLYAALGAAIIAIIALASVIAAQYRTLQKESLLGPHGTFLASLKSRGTITPQDGAFIEEWMTFDYLNRVFSLPPDYLKGALSISDPRYPHVAIQEYASDAHRNEAETLDAVRSAVESYAPAQ